MHKYLIAAAFAFTLGMPHANAASGNVNSVNTQQPKIPSSQQRQPISTQQFKPPSSQRSTTLNPASDYKSGPKQQPRTPAIDQQKNAINRAQAATDNSKAAADASRDRAKAAKQEIGRFVDKARSTPPPKF